MLSIETIRGDGSYWTQLARANYYTEGGEPPGQWLGGGAEALGLNGQEVDTEALKKVLQGFHPKNDTKLVQNAGKENRHRGYDLCFSAPKSVSVLWAAAPQWMKKEIEASLAKGVEDGIRYLEEHAVFSRRGRQGSEPERAKPLVAVFAHSTSRAQEPQLHYHALFPNVAVRDDQTTGTLYGQVLPQEDGKPKKGWNPLLEHKKAAGSVFQLSTAADLVERLGVEIEPAQDGFSFRIKNISSAAEDFCSTRSKEIEKEKQKSGFKHGKGSYLAAKTTREEKFEVNRKQLCEEYSDKLTGFGLTGPRLEQLCNRAGRPKQPFERLGPAIIQAEAELTEDQNNFLLSDLFEKTANLLVASGITYSDLKAAINCELTEGAVVSLGYEKLQPRLSSKAVLQLEYEATLSIERARACQSHVVSPERIDKALKRTEATRGIEYDEDYRSALQYLVSGRIEGQENVGSFRVLTGDAGAGKTTLLSTAKQAWELDGYRVVGAALAGAAKERLKEQAGIESYTLDKWCHEIGKGVGKRLAHHGRMLGRAALGKETWAIDSRCYLDEKTVLVVDEATLADTPKLYKIQIEAEKAGALLVMTGDEKQCQAIGLGGAFTTAKRMTAGVTISRNFRQKEREDQELVSLAAQGHSLGVLENLVSRNRLHVEESSELVRERLVQDWKLDGVSNPEENKIFVGRHKDRLALNELCQKERIAAWKRSTSLLGFQNHEGQTIYAGDVIQFRDNIRLRKQTDTSFLGQLAVELQKANPFVRNPVEEIRRGQFGTVVSINPILKNMRVKMKDGNTLTVPLEVIDNEERTALGEPGRHLLSNKPKTRRLQVSLGYATTTHAGQGSDFENVFVLASGSMQDQELTYTQLTRGRSQTRLYATAMDAGKELTLRSRLNDLDGTGETAKIHEDLVTARLTSGEKMEDSPLAQMMATSRRKKFALEEGETKTPAETLDYTPEKDQQFRRRM